MSRYNFIEVEKKWQKHWEDSKLAEVEISATQPKYYVLEMFPYPSGRVHVGHLRNYALGDIVARYRVACGYNVLHPMGWDAFGLPAENAAHQNKIPPRTWTLQNIEGMKQQFKKIGCHYAWGREIATCNPDYYHQQQKLFLALHRGGLAYQKESYVNWDPVEHTVLANEQVIDGRGWRSGALVERKLLTQWFLKITAYADDLLAGLQKLPEWPKRVLTMQDNWIGRSEGAHVTFVVDGRPETLNIFTTRPETLFGASFVALSPQHPLVASLPQSEALSAFLRQCTQQSTDQASLDKAEKIGFDTGLCAISPVESTRKLPIYLANFVLSDYGTGALFGCPAHDERDLEFALKYNLPIRPVIASDNNPAQTALAILHDGPMIHSQFLDGMPSQDAKKAMIHWLEEHQKGRGETCFRLRDWGVSRQRYWGCPIPMVHCPSCGVVPEREENLPILLPDDVSFDRQGNPLAHHPTWKHTQCPTCGGPATRETDTLDTFFDSSWYFLRFCSPQADAPFDRDAANHWMPIDKYVGGVEHAILHLLYARFFTRALHDQGLTAVVEPFKSLLTQGMVCHPTYKDPDGNWLFPGQVTRDDAGNPVMVDDKTRRVTIGRSEKMSKSLKNVVEPDAVIAHYGADAARLFVLSDTPPERDLQWSEEGIEGAWRYINRVWKFVAEHRAKLLQDSDDTPDTCGDALSLRRHIHESIAAVTHAIETDAFNVAIAHIRTLSNSLMQADISKIGVSVMREGITNLVQLLQPITPHLAYELWFMLGQKNDLGRHPWPKADATLLARHTVTLAVQVNGKTRGTLELPADASNAMIEESVMQMAEVIKHLNAMTPKRIIIVPGRIVNVVV